MPLISKPNYNQIFASQAPEQDKPAVFNNYPEGWGPESRPNNGKPTIKGFNYLQQTSDLKDLWILQNGAALPYDATMEYAEGAVVVKDGVLQQWKGGVWKSAVAEVATFAELATAFGYSPTGGRRQVVVGDLIRVVGIGATYRVASDGAFDAHLDYTGSGGVKLYVIRANGWNFLSFGCRFDGATDDSSAFLSALRAADGDPIYAPDGTTRISEVVYSGAARIVGSGTGKTTIELATTGTQTILTADKIEIERCTISDRGRAALNHTTNPDVYIFVAKNGFRSVDCDYITDRSVLNQTGGTGKCFVSGGSVTRATAPVVSEADGMNLFVGTGQIDRVDFYGVSFFGIICRSVVNFTYGHPSPASDIPVTARMIGCQFEYVRNNGSGGEVKLSFFQGYNTAVEQNTFLDCFGRHIDILGHYTAGSRVGVNTFSRVTGNKISYTLGRQAVTGASNNEAGSIYCRYADASVENNTLDFTNLLLVSNTYGGIVVRHGFQQATVRGNTVRSAKAEAIRVDISEAIDVDNCVAVVTGNDISSINSNRYCLLVANNSAAKTFANVVVEANTIRYGINATFGFGLESTLPRTSSFGFDHVTIRGNWNPLRNTRDEVNLVGYPQSMTAPEVTVAITVNPVGSNANGIMTSLSDALDCIKTYRVKSLTIQLAAAVTTTQTISGPLAYTVRPDFVTIAGDNGVGGRIRALTAGANQNGLTLGMAGQRVLLSGCMLESDAGTSTTSLVVGTGWGTVELLNCNCQNAEYVIDTRGVHASIKGGTINNINLGNTGNNGIFYARADRLVHLSIEDTTGANNTRLYNLTTPAILVYDSISVGTVDGLKGFTMVT